MSMGKIEVKDAMIELRRKRLDAFRHAHETHGNSSMDHIVAEADAITTEEWGIMWAAREFLDDFARLYAELHGELQQEWARGLRCGVCGMTANQARAAGYDCVREC